jgi:hypothetical protein
MTELFTASRFLYQPQLGRCSVSSAESHPITPERLLDGGTRTLCVVVRSHKQRRLRPLFKTLIASILSASFERASESGGPIDPACPLVLDEAPTSRRCASSTRLRRPLRARASNW